MNNSRGTSPISIPSLLLFAGTLVALFYLAKGVFSLLYWVSPILLIATLIMDYKTVTGYLKYVWNSLQNNFVVGIVLTLLTLLFPPVVIGFLFAKVLMQRKLKNFVETKTTTSSEETYTDYEEVVEDVEEDFLELPPLEAPKAQKTGSQTNDYDNLFN